MYTCSKRSLHAPGFMNIILYSSLAVNVSNLRGGIDVRVFSTGTSGPQRKGRSQAAERHEVTSKGSPRSA